MKYEPNTGGVVMPCDELDVSDDCIWLGSRQVARLNPTLLASERDYVEHILNPDPVILARKTGEPFEPEDFIAAVAQLKRKLHGKMKAGLLCYNDFVDAIDELCDDFGLE